jgi:hypothetical protein
VEVEEARIMLEEYQRAGAATPVPGEGSKHLIPWFIIKKREGSNTKVRLISDCRSLNEHFNLKTIRLDHLPSIFPYLRKNQWCAKFDPKDAYFHLMLHPTLRPFVRLGVGFSVGNSKEPHSG